MPSSARSLPTKKPRHCRGGRLVELLDAAFEALGHEAQADDKLASRTWSISWAEARHDARSTSGGHRQAERFPAIKGLVAEYRSRTETLGHQQTVQQDRAEVLNRLYQFFLPALPGR